MKITQKELQLICEDLMKAIWNDKLDIPVTISKRLINSLGTFHAVNKKVNGKYVFTPLKITISANLLEHYSLDNIEGTIKHELCHYYLCKTGQDFEDGDRTFENELKRIGSHSSKSLCHTGEMHTCVCSNCGNVVVRARTKRKTTNILKDGYISKCCRANMLYGGVEITNDYNVKNVNYKSDESVSVIRNYVSESPSVKVKIQNKDNNKTNNKLTIEDIIAAQTKGGIKAKVYKALITAIQEKSAEKINLIAKHYPEQFAYECIKFSKKRMDYLNSILN